MGRIADAAFSGPVRELLDAFVRKLPTPPKPGSDGEAYAREVRFRFSAATVDLPVPDDSGAAGHQWPGSGLTGDDMRRLRAIGNATGLRANGVLHHAVVITHHLFRCMTAEMIEQHRADGTPVGEIVAAMRRANGNGHGGTCSAGHVTAVAHGHGDCPGRSASAPCGQVEHATVSAIPADPTDGVAAEPDSDRPVPSLPPHPMTRPSSAARSGESITEETAAELAERIEQLHETMRVVITAIDELREDLVHAIRNLPDRLPAPLHIHSLPRDPTDPDFGDRVNAVPDDILTRLRDEAARVRSAASVPATAAEGDPPSAAVIDERPAGNHRPSGRQGKLFA